MKYLVLSALTFLISLYSLSAEESKIIGNEESILAKIGKKQIRLEDIQNKEIHDLRKQLYDLLKQELKSRVIQELSSYSGKYSTDLKYEVKEKDIKTFYNKNNLKKRGTYKELKPQIKRYLEAKLLEQQVDQLYEEALDKNLFVSYLDDPGRYVVKVPVETAFIRGNEKADVMVLEFSDYQCPFCSRVQPSLNALRKKYGNKVAFGYRHLPLTFHTEADEAAIAAECSRDQGKFEEYHELLFQNRSNQSIDDLKSYAKKVKVKDLKQFNTCLDQEKYRNRVNHDMYVAQSVGIQGTPGFVIGKVNREKGILEGEVLSGALPEEEFVKTLDKYLN